MVQSKWNVLVQERRENSRYHLGTRLLSIVRACDPNCVTQHQVGDGGGVGGSAASTIESQCRDQSNTGEKVDQGVPHALQKVLKGMGDGGGEQAPGWNCHHFERGGRIVGLRRDELWSKYGEFSQSQRGGENGMSTGHTFPPNINQRCTRQSRR